MPFVMLREGREMANQSPPGGVEQNSRGVKHFLKRVKKNLGGLTPLTPRKSAHGDKVRVR